MIKDFLSSMPIFLSPITLASLCDSLVTSHHFPATQIPSAYAPTRWSHCQSYFRVEQYWLMKVHVGWLLFVPINSLLPFSTDITPLKAFQCWRQEKMLELLTPRAFLKKHSSSWLMSVGVFMWIKQSKEFSLDPHHYEMPPNTCTLTHVHMYAYRHYTHKIHTLKHVHNHSLKYVHVG